MIILVTVAFVMGAPFFRVREDKLPKDSVYSNKCYNSIRLANYTAGGPA
jgi:hypothetical protein